MMTFAYPKWIGLTMRFASIWLVVLTFHSPALADGPGKSDSPEAVAADAIAAAPEEAKLISGTKQVTFGGLRAGEGYFSGDGQRMVFQSERDPANPFYQIFVMDFENGDIQQVSPGSGKTTCAWIHPDGAKVLFASTHHDPESSRLQQEELDLRASGQQRRYAWDYDPEFELYEHDLATGKNRRLTETRGYDAEASYSPDGKSVLFASNRQAYERQLSEREKTLFELDPASMIDIYKLDLASGEVIRLTDTLGYDGGPFFSPDGKRFCWRRFSEDGATAEIYTMSVDGGEATRLTSLNAMSWAPFYHPSGEYLVFTTNLHGFANFELYLVRADGKGKPVRASFTEGFDGLPVFLPDGNQIAWTSTRASGGRSQIFMGQWNHAAARTLLGLGTEADADDPDRLAAIATAELASPEFSPADIGRHVDYLTRPELGGRLTGTEGERRATQYVAAYLESLGFEPAGTDGSWFQTFEFPAGSELTAKNSLTIAGEELTLGKAWQPLSFSGDGDFESAPVVFAGYGMVAPASGDFVEYDSYVHLDVKDKWVMVLRDMPQDIKPEMRQHLARYSAPRRKATVARDLGARGIIFVTGPTSGVKNELIRFDRDASAAGVSMAVVSIDNVTAAKMMAKAEKDLAKEQKSLDGGEMAMGYELPGVTVSATVGIDRKTGTGRNVMGRLRTGPAEKVDPPAEGKPMPSDRPMVMVGAHIDHLGVGGGTNSLATEEERDQVHVGADDNASGVAAMLEIAQFLAVQQKRGKLNAKRDLLIVGWSGEELGLFGSQAFVKSFFELYPRAPRVPNPFGDVVNDPQAKLIMAAHGMSEDDEPLSAAISAYLNLDMVGRLREKLVIQGVGSSPTWADEVQRRNVPVGLELELDKTASRLPTDAASFVPREVPILAAFTGAHEDYHTPRDTPEKLNYEGAAKIAHLFALITRGVLTADQPPVFELEEGAQPSEVPRANLTAYLGTIPDYVAGEIKGMRLSGVGGNGPAAKAGVKGGDVIVELAGRKIENVYDYTFAIEALKIGDPVKVVLIRDGKNIELEITPTARE
ncbi:MAG TPA: peptidase M28 [Planctomycetaceae bacterium]|nr:peptidase M28 [Planctomycetaceae bacterium]